MSWEAVRRLLESATPTYEKEERMSTFGYAGKILRLDLSSGSASPLSTVDYADGFLVDRASLRSSIGTKSHRKPVLSTQRMR